MGAALEGLEVLEGEDGGGGEDGDLARILHGLEGGAHGDLGLAVADVAAEEAVHGLGGLHVALDVCDGGELVVGLCEIEGLVELALEGGVWRKGEAFGGFAGGVELEQLVGHVLHGLLDAGFGFGPLGVAELVELGRGAGFGGAVLLDEVEAGERNVEARGVGELEDHELDVEAVLLDLAEALIAGDAVFDVDDVVADGEVAEVGEEGGGFGAARRGAGGDVGLVADVLRAEEDEATGGGAVEVKELHTIGDGRGEDDGDEGGGVLRLFGEGAGGGGVFGAGADAIGDAVGVERGGEAIHLGLVRDGEDDGGLLRDEGFELLSERGDGAVEARRGAGGDLDGRKRVLGGFEDIHCAELVEVAAGEMRKALVEFGGSDVDVGGADERADAGALVALLDLGPPAFGLVANHGRLFDEDARCGAAGGEEIEERVLSAGDGSEELPAGKCADIVEVSGVCFGFGEAGVDGGQQFFGDGSLGEREQERGVEGVGAALRLGVEGADGFDLVAEEVEADGAVGFGGVDVHDAAADGDLAGHLDDIDFGVADAEEMLEEHVGEMLFAAAEMEGEAGVVVGREEAHAGGLDGRDEDAAGAGGELPERGGSLLEEVGVGGEIFEGENIVRGEGEDLRGRERAGEMAGGGDGCVEGFGGFVVCDEDERGGVERADEGGKDEGAGGAGESGDTPTPRAGCQMQPHTLERLGGFQVREERADEGKKHGFSLAHALTSSARCNCYYTNHYETGCTITALCGFMHCTCNRTTARTHGFRQLFCLFHQHLRVGPLL